MELIAVWTKEDCSLNMVEKQRIGGLSTRITLLGSYFPFLLEQLSECAKSATPNMKKKKAAEFDEVKTNILKPLK